MIERTSGQSIPIPNAIVLITICNGDNGLVNDSMIRSFTLDSVQEVYMSISLNLEISGASFGSNISDPNCFLKYEYRVAH